jgi:hypothetical protein
MPRIRRSLGRNYDGSAAKTEGFGRVLMKAIGLAVSLVLVRVTADDEIRNKAIGATINQRGTVGRSDISTCGYDDCMPGGDVPIMGRRKPRIKVGGSFGNSAKFDG